MQILHQAQSKRLRLKITSDERLQLMQVSSHSKLLIAFSQACSEISLNESWFISGMCLYQFLIAVRAEGAQLTSIDGETTSHLREHFTEQFVCLRKESSRFMFLMESRQISRVVSF